MKIHNGTSQASKLFNRLKNEGILVDLYSKEFFDKNQNGPTLYLENFDRMLEVEDGTNEDYSAEKFPIGHLLVICISLAKDKDIKELVNIYTPLDNVLRAGIHHPNFLIFNLYTKQILAVGLGRKNRLFCIDVLSNQAIDPFDSTHNSSHNSYIQKFTEHDVIDFVMEDLIGPLYSLGNSFFEQDHLPYIEDLYSLKEAEPNEEGLYDLDGYDDGVSLQEINDLIEEYEDHQNSINDSIGLLQCFFPELSEGELNTGDY